MSTIYDIDATELIEEAAKELKSVEAIKPPVWAIFVKTGHSKERPPARKDWWHVRTAAVLRKVYRFGPIGVSKIRGMYGAKKNKGSAAEHSYKGSGNVIRKVLQQLEKAEFVRQGKIGLHKGRIITPKGRKFLDDIATKLKSTKKEVKVEEKPEAKPKAEVKPKAKETEAKPKEAKPVEEKKAETKEEQSSSKPQKSKISEKPKQAPKKPSKDTEKGLEKMESPQKEESEPKAEAKPKAEKVKTEEQAKQEPKEQKTE
ncbi:30S ribosomal protein S19e [Candidatus Woesearchaeota archaeon]|nr:30S ribosomal protein S19e [Candidatus Woesearchaeota archaeon]